MYIMKCIVLFLTVFSALAFADGASPLGAIHPTATGSVDDDPLLWAQPYSSATLQNGYRYYDTSTGEGYMVDDFFGGGEFTIKSIRIWMIYQGANPETYEVAFIEDAGDANPNNGTVAWSGTMTCTHVDTGDDLWGYDIWETTGVLSNYPTLPSFDRYWLVLRFQGEEYWLVQPPVSGSYPWLGPTTIELLSCADPSMYGETSDSYFALYAPPVPIVRESWGSIKSIF